MDKNSLPKKKKNTLDERLVLLGCNTGFSEKVCSSFPVTSYGKTQTFRPTELQLFQVLRKKRVADISSNRIHINIHKELKRTKEGGE